MNIYTYCRICPGWSGPGTYHVLATFFGHLKCACGNKFKADITNDIHAPTSIHSAMLYGVPFDDWMKENSNAFVSTMLPLHVQDRLTDYICSFCIDNIKTVMSSLSNAFVAGSSIIGKLLAEHTATSNNDGDDRDNMVGWQQLT